MSVTALVVDDSAAARQTIIYYLRLRGCTIVGEAGNGADAIRLFQELKPNLVTLDLMMPIKNEIDSLTALRVMKNEAPHAAIIVVSAIPFENSRRSFIDEGVFAYLVKPFNDYALSKIRHKLERAFPELRTR
jgi:two-component system, chemotaxis family, chemotaxis protein CheY